ncbi:MAG: hypothetical protein FJX74_25975, partial [Armatimonadetes bacterium]|nr:hypothetical protein [Armatimonadota bacterium]
MRVAIALALILALVAPLAFAGAPATVTVVVKQPPQRVVLKLVPDYALVLAFDRPIGTVGIGDDTLVATAVRETDLIMKALRSSGRTNLLVWAGDVRTVWEIVVNRAERTADIVQVITQQPTPPSPPPAAPPQESSTRFPAGDSSSWPVPERLNAGTAAVAPTAQPIFREDGGVAGQPFSLPLAEPFPPWRSISDTLSICCAPASSPAERPVPHSDPAGAATWLDAR